MRNFWIGIIALIFLSIGNWYVQSGGFVDKSDFEEVVEHTLKSKEGLKVIHKNKNQDYGVVVYHAEDEELNEHLYLGFFKKADGKWHLEGTSIFDGEWGIDSVNGSWIYFGLVTEPSVKKIFVGDDPVPLRSVEGSPRYWYYFEPKGYNYPINGIRSDGSEYWIKEK
ncbi:hypothetical protein [Bacillus sp. Marseille-Q3570]|uniref:hypothetical protein n=1 Tax=Bacillus sp. Marseille-Q3570 TaxID=2963522 RepID=UPI0021B70762|nr:hypothetical protein [Bacillus sp. Marseille-Q3570]